MIAGSKLSCIGVIGDGCGGGREFIIENGILSAFDPQTKENIILLENIFMPNKISKKACIISIECENEIIKFDLSSMSKSIEKV